ncbi:MAG: cell division protein FtsZ, partial [Candidatus Methanoperedens sp.]
TTEVDRLSSDIGHVFKGVLLRDGVMPRVLTVLSIGASVELDKLFDIGVQAIGKEQVKKEQIAMQNQSISDKLEGLQPLY